MLSDIISAVAMAARAKDVGNGVTRVIDPAADESRLPEMR
jgi:hypothetical protein